MQKTYEIAEEKSVEYDTQVVDVQAKLCNDLKQWFSTGVPQAFAKCAARL
jgi:hypothetical protein